MLDELIPVEVYDRLRTEYRSRVIELKRRRRVELGPAASLLFESRATVLAQVQEVVWLERPLRPERVAEEIREYERLLPQPGELKATLMLHGGPCSAGVVLLRRLFLGEPALVLRLGKRLIPALPLLPHDDPACPVQYLRFGLDVAAIGALCDRSTPAELGLDFGGEVQCRMLSAETRDELARDFLSAGGEPLPAGLRSLPAGLRSLPAGGEVRWGGAWLGRARRSETRCASHPTATDSASLGDSPPAGSNKNRL